METIILTWKEPDEPWSRKKQRFWPTGGRWTGIWALCAGATLFAIFRNGFSVSPLLGWGVLGVQYAFDRVRRTYFVTETGLKSVDGHRRHSHCWADIEWYRIWPTSGEDGVTMLEFKVAKTAISPWQTWYFDESIDRQLLVDTLNHYLPTKEISFTVETTGQTPRST